MAKRMVPNKKAMDAVAKQTQTPKPISQIMPGKKVVKKPVKQQPTVQPPVEQPKPVELPKEEVKLEQVQKQKPSNSMVFQPISKKKNSAVMVAEGNTSWENPNVKTIPPVLEVPAKQPENSGPGLSLNLDTIVNTVVDSMMDKFVTREEMHTLVEATIKKMILENSIKNK